MKKIDASLNRITFNLEGREFYWDILPGLGFALAQSLVQALGPAKGEVED